MNLYLKYSNVLTDLGGICSRRSRCLVVMNFLKVGTVKAVLRVRWHTTFCPYIVRYILCPTGIKLWTEGMEAVTFSSGELCDTGYHDSHLYFGT